LPALKPGAKVVIQDYLLPEPNVMPLLAEMQIRCAAFAHEICLCQPFVNHDRYRSIDCIMQSMFNSRERDEDDWRRLFQAVDERFGPLTVTKIMDNPPSGIVVATWT
jgi:hypothetical protein